MYAKLVTSGERYDATYVSLQTIPKHKVAIIFGAKVYKDGVLSPYLRDRVQTGIDLFKAGHVEKLLMSGGQGNSPKDEPTTMAEFAKAGGVPERAILLDPNGLDTHATCLNAKEKFNINQAVLISQGYHIPRAIVVCDGVGVESVAVAAIRPDGNDSSLHAIFREFLSTDKAFLQALSD